MPPGSRRDRSRPKKQPPGSFLQKCPDERCSCNVRVMIRTSRTETSQCSSSVSPVFTERRKPSNCGLDLFFRRGQPPATCRTAFPAQYKILIETTPLPRMKATLAAACDTLHPRLKPGQSSSFKKSGAGGARRTVGRLSSRGGARSSVSWCARSSPSAPSPGGAPDNATVCSRFEFSARFKILWKPDLRPLVFATQGLREQAARLRSRRSTRRLARSKRCQGESLRPQKCDPRTWGSLPVAKVSL